jgi:hypothetical protein
MDEGETGAAGNDPHLVVLDEMAQALRTHFLGWQCRIRQYSIRQGGGRPAAGMQPLVLASDKDSDLGRITVLIVKSQPQEVITQFRHMVRKTNDPAERYNNALKFLAAAYYQQAQTFSDEMTALFGSDSELADHLLEAGHCRLLFEQYNQRYLLPCALRSLREGDPAFQATYWHNGLFNPALPAGVRVLAFRPDWATGKAEPPAA